MDYKIFYSNRKSLTISIRNGELQVRAPFNMSKTDIDKFVLQKEKWINKHLVNEKERFQNREKFTLNYGDIVFFRGKEYLITERDSNLAGFDEKVFYMPKGMNPESIKATCVHLYRILAKKYLTHRTLILAKQMSLSPRAIKINGALTRWGSCSNQKRINYSWRLVLADDDVIDYVIVHELAHFKEMNHSEKFWKIVENILPDYIERKEKLRELQKKLYSEKWE
ncbi:MAG: M48 family metallopeptidase [Candidatus Cloacimonetes bacterium]|nr:M48 family metallopeptidase [Candidatus Cloacimonadota bacterium]